MMVEEYGKGDKVGYGNNTKRGVSGIGEVRQSDKDACVAWWSGA